MKINVHAGHNPDGKTACGAIGLIKESTEARKVKKYVIKYLKKMGHTVYDCTVDNGTSQSDVLNKIVKKCNAHSVDLDISIHFNSGANDKKGNSKTTGTEVLVYKLDSGINVKIAKQIASEIETLGFRNRGVKANPSLYVLNSTKAPAMLIECCFVDDADDIKLYDAKTMAKKIVKGIAKAHPFDVVTTKKGVYLRQTAGSNVTKTGRLAKGAKCTISNVSIKSGIVYGYIKNKKQWISLVNTRLA